MSIIIIIIIIIIYICSIYMHMLVHSPSVIMTLCNLLLTFALDYIYRPIILVHSGSDTRFLPLQIISSTSFKKKSFYFH